MKLVGHHLRREAATRPAGEKDDFARSAYSRYYYYIYIESKKIFVQINPAWSATPHKSYPDVFGVSIVKKLKAEALKARRINDWGFNNQIQATISACNNMKEIMIKAKTAREISDYDINDEVIFYDSDFIVGSFKISEAATWTEKADAYLSLIEKTWKQING